MAKDKEAASDADVSHRSPPCQISAVTHSRKILAYTLFDFLFVFFLKFTIACVPCSADRWYEKYLSKCLYNFFRFTIKHFFLNDTVKHQDIIESNVAEHLVG